MGWVNHKKIRERIASKRSAISDETFFTSRIFVAHLEEIVAVQLNRYKYRRRVRIKIFWNTKDPFIAATDHMVIMVNAGNSLVTKADSRTDRYNVIPITKSQSGILRILWNTDGIQPLPN